MENSLNHREIFLKSEMAKLIISLSLISIVSFIFFYLNGLGLAYNDARSHLDIGRRVVEGLNTGFAQLGSVWLPLTHLLMGLTIWNDFMWHSGLSGAIQSMISFVATGIFIYLFLGEIGAGKTARIAAVVLFATNINILYLQSTAMTELVLLSTTMGGSYYLLKWFKTENILFLLYCAFFVMLSSLVRYDGWFTFLFIAALIAIFVYKKYKKYSKVEGIVILFSTLASLGIVLWFLWNALIFKDPMYFAFGPYSAYAQQNQLSSAGVLPSKGDWIFSLKIYMYAMAYNIGAFTMFVGFAGALVFWFSKKNDPILRLASLALIAPLIFNILALYLGHSVLYIQGISGNTWFNVRYGIMMMPSIAIFVGYLIHALRPLRNSIISLLAFTIIFSFASVDAVTIDDARVGSSQKNVKEVSGWLNKNANDAGFILISAASHDSIIFSSGLPMKKFINEGSGLYYEEAIKNPDSWARWIVMRTHSDDDSTWREMKNNPDFLEKYSLVDHYPFADIYQLKEEYVKDLITQPVLKNPW